MGDEHMRGPGPSQRDLYTGRLHWSTRLLQSVDEYGSPCNRPKLPLLSSRFSRQLSLRVHCLHRDGLSLAKPERRRKGGEWLRRRESCLGALSTLFPQLITIIFSQ